MKCSWKWGALVGVLMFALGNSPARATILINELLVNPPSSDNGSEFIELLSTTGGVEAMTGLWFLAIEGDGTNAGSIDVALSLNSFSTGTNGLFLWRDNAAVLSPAPAAATTLNVADFNPDIENGSNTYLIVSGFTGSVGNDLDTDNDGVIDVTLPWTTTVDAVGFVENDGAANVQYATALGGISFGGISEVFTPDAFNRFQNGQPRWFDVLGSAPGPWTADATNLSGPMPPNFTLTPGSPNPVPEPSTLALAALGLVGVAAVARRRAA